MNYSEETLIYIGFFLWILDIHKMHVIKTLSRGWQESIYSVNTVADDDMAT